MKITVYDDPEKFLSKTRAELEKQEVVNGLILGVVQRLVDEPEQIETDPYLAVVEDDSGETVLIAMMTPPFPLSLAEVGDCPGEALQLLADNLHTNKWTVSSVHGPDPLSERFAPVWAEKINADYELEMGQGIYELRKVIPLEEVPGRLVLSQPDEVDLISAWMQAFESDVFGEPQATLEKITEAMAHRLANREWYIWKDGEQPLSMVTSSRPTRHGICVAGVYTPPELRGKGYASASVAAFSQKLLDEGYEFTSLFTDLANPTSNKIYMNVGYQHVCDFNKYKFLG